ncbi:hypothetical protein LX36DRAFT_103305 [Colletotrichum falcatum]|nr:hypothetical protein LX36DRAFT_103305 [Colletotrichum falcatum]
MRRWMAAGPPLGTGSLFVGLDAVYKCGRLRWKRGSKSRWRGKGGLDEMGRGSRPFLCPGSRSLCWPLWLSLSLALSGSAAGGEEALFLEGWLRWRVKKAHGLFFLLVPFCFLSGSSRSVAPGRFLCDWRVGLLGLRGGGGN